MINRDLPLQKHEKVYVRWDDVQADQPSSQGPNNLDFLLDKSTATQHFVIQGHGHDLSGR